MDEILSELEKIGAEAKQIFGNLSAEQLNWKENAESWSVAQCFEHLIITNSAFFPELESIIKGERKQNLWEKVSPFSGLLGKLMIKSLDPKSERKLKAPQKIQPAASEISAAIIEDFVQRQTKLADKIKQTESLDTKKIILTSPIAKAVTYSLFDAYRIIVTHEKRHFQQAERVTQNDGFPK